VQEKTQVIIEAPGFGNSGFYSFFRKVRFKSPYLDDQNSKSLDTFTQELKISGLATESLPKENFTEVTGS
jgi:hypothetical protein